jgi:hypothetical protein
MLLWGNTFSQFMGNSAEGSGAIMLIEAAPAQISGQRVFSPGGCFRHGAQGVPLFPVDRALDDVFDLH